MQNLRVSLIQANQVWEDKSANLANYDELLSNINADLVLLPEMFHTGFTMDCANLAEGVDTDLGISWLKKTAEEKNFAIYTSLIVKEGAKFYNRGVFVEPKGTVYSYDKRKTFGLAGEDKLYSCGYSEVIINYKNWNIQLQICYDLRFPELVRNRIVNGKPAYDVLLYVANWPEKRILHWEALLKARAIENQCYALGVNRVGIDGLGIEYSGNSLMIDPMGVETRANNHIEESLNVVINRDDLNKTRELLPFLKDR